MSKRSATVLALVLALLAIAATTFFSVHLARRQGLEFEIGRVFGYARDVLRSSDIAADQFVNAVAMLEAHRSAQPCSDTIVAVMRGLSLISSNLKAVGYVAGDRLMCSSLGKFAEGLPLGPVDTITDRGVALRLDVALEFAGGKRFTVAERDGYAAIVPRDMAIDTTTRQPNVLLATFTPGTGELRSSRGAVKREWIDALGKGTETSFVDGTHLVAVVRSKQYANGAIAALPLANLERQVRASEMLLVPVGVVAGIVLALAILYFARMQLALPAILKVALRRHEFFVNYQPIVDLQTGRWVGAEALIRWRRHTGEMVRPDLFIPAAEDAGLIRLITARVIQLVTRDVAGLFERHAQFHIGINLSSEDLHDEATIERLRRLAADTRASAGNLVIEASERGLAEPQVAGAIVRELRASGLHVAIDDFGTGYSSLSYLERFEFDYLKIDKSFIDTIGTGAATSQVVLHIIEMAKALKLKIVAEGVETRAQADFLRERGVQYAQGWLYGKPMSCEELRAGLAAGNAATAG